MGLVRGGGGGGEGEGGMETEPLCNLRTLRCAHEDKFYRSLLPQITEAYIFLKSDAILGISKWQLTKIDTYYKSAKKSFYWNYWVPTDTSTKLKKTGRLHLFR